MIKRLLYEAVFLFVLTTGVSLYFNSLKTVPRHAEQKGKGIVNIWDVLFSLYPGITLAAFHHAYHQKDVRIDTISASVADLEIKLSESEKARINAMLIPHMMTNLWATFEEIIARRPQDARYALSIIHELLRNYAKLGPAQMIPLRAELDLVERYLVLLELKLGTKPCLEIRADPGIYQELVIPMLIFLHVENMGKYAVLDDPRRACLIQIEKLDGKLHIRVENEIRKKAQTPVISTQQGLASMRGKMHNLGLECTVTDHSVSGRFIMVMVIRNS